MLLYTAYNPDKTNACQYYRIETPVEQLHKLFGVDFFYDEITGDKEEAIKAAISSDIAFFYNTMDDTTKYQLDTLRAIKPAKSDGQLLIPPTCIYDSDDNVDYVHPFNPAYVSYGVRNYPDGSFISPGETLEWADDEEKRLVLWEDKVTTNGSYRFDISKNYEKMAYRHYMIKNSHGATASTKALASYFKNVLGQPNVHVFPNTIVPSHYEYVEVVRRDPEKVRILWQGGNSHYIDWYPLKEALKIVSQKYPNIKWVIFGEWMNWVHDVLPDGMVEHHPFVHYHAYKYKRGLLNIDINLCPLADNSFNRCKSAIKWYEASIWDKPEATLAADVEPYREIENGKTGLLYRTPEEFVEKLSALIENIELRKTLGAGAKSWVVNNRLPQHTIPDLYNFYVETRTKQYYDAGGERLIVPARS